LFQDGLVEKAQKTNSSSNGNLLINRNSCTHFYS